MIDNKYTSELHNLLAEMKEFGEAQHVPIINANGLKVLETAVAAKRPKRVLEIGTAIGYSALYIAANAAEGVEITTLELDPVRAEQARGFWQRSIYNGQIHQLVGDAGELLLQLEGQYDLVFIDAAKGQYPDYFRKIYPYLTEDAVVIADNVLFRGYVLDEVPVPRRFRTIVKRLREYIALVTESEEFVTEIHRDGDGLAVSQRRKK